MKKLYRHKTASFEAEQFNPYEEHKTILPEGINGYPSPASDNWAYAGCTFWLRKDGESIDIYNGDWIITEFDGELYVCQNKYFVKIYEEVLINERNDDA